MKTLLFTLSCLFLAACSTSSTNSRIIASDGGCQFEGRAFQAGDYVFFSDLNDGNARPAEAVSKFVECVADKIQIVDTSGNYPPFYIDHSQIVAVTDNEKLSSYCSENSAAIRLETYSKKITFPTNQKKDLESCEHQGLIGCKVGYAQVKGGGPLSVKDKEEIYSYCHGISGKVGACMRMAKDPGNSSKLVHRVIGYKREKVEEHLQSFPDSCEMQKFCTKTRGVYAPVETAMLGCQ